MDNLEEVLQALDEFQKMRPTVIPQELEDYLCWVAKTGDPVYQWSLIKTLFREKLTRVMTDFYENCPTLELAPCPNVEHFNYDTMKSNLLERLESFANAPFTVQRICELLTAPRKEYNRVDKFMRAIEKNILVVSTREPGPIARRGETGDGMMNGSVEEDTASITQQQPPPPPPSPSPSQSQSLATQALSQPSQTTQPVQQTSQDVEMEYWEKDCNSTVTISVHTVENEPPLLHSSVMPTAGSPLAKNVFSADENSREKLEQAVSRTEIATPSYASAASDFSTISHLASQTHEPVSTVPAGLVVHSLPTQSVATVSSDTSVGNTNVTETIINDNTNSQNNLELENEDVEATNLATVATTAMTTTTATTTTPSATSTSASTTTVTVVATVIPLTTDTTRKLQAAFQAKRYESDDGDKCLDKSDEKSSDSSTADNLEEGIGHSVKSEEGTSTKTNSEYIHSDEMSRDESRLNESLLQTDVEMRSDTLANNVPSVAEERISEKSEEETASILKEISEENLHSKSDEDTKTAVCVDSQSLTKKDSTITSNIDGATAVIVSNNEALFKPEKIDTFTKEEPVSSKESYVHDQSVNQNTENAEGTDKASEILRLVSSSNDNRQEVRDPEINSDNLKMTEISNDKTVESMDSEPMSVVEKPKEVMSVIEKLDLVTSNVEMAENLDNGNCSSPKDDKLDVQDDNLETMQSNQATTCIKENQSSVIECRKEQDQMELMEVEEEEPLSTQDESMEQETTEDLPKS